MVQQAYRLLDRSLSLLEQGLLVAALVASTASLIADITLRNTVGMALPWAAELTRYAIVWMVFVGAAVAAREGSHITIDIVGEALPLRLGKAVGIAAMLISAAACALFAVIAGKLVMQMLMFRQLSPSLEIPMWTVYLAIPVGFLLMAVRFLQAAVAAASKDAAPVPSHIAAG